MTERFLSKLYDRSALVADLLTAVGARITTWGYHKDTLTGKATHDERKITVDDYVSFVELPELLAPNVYKVETEETNVPYVGKMITQTTTYYKDGSYDVDFFEITPAFDSYKTQLIFDKIKDLDADLRQRYLQGLADLEITGSMDVTHDAGTHDAKTCTVPYGSKGYTKLDYVATSFDNNTDSDVICIRKIYEDLKDLGWHCTNVTVVQKTDCMFKDNTDYTVFDFHYNIAKGDMTYGR